MIQQQLDLVLPEHQPAPDNEPDLIPATIALLAHHLSKEPIVTAWSGGKDSTATLVLVLCAALQLLEEGQTPSTIIVEHGDTEIENPNVAWLANTMLDDLRRWSETVGIDLRVQIYRPALSATYAVNVLSGGMHPSYYNHKHYQCQAKYKLDPAMKSLGQTLPTLAKDLEARIAAGDLQARALLDRLDLNSVPLTVVGSRLDESQRRKRSMERHGFGAIQPELIGKGKQSRRILAPIAHWTEDDVWELLALAGTQGTDHPVWRYDFSDLIELYRQAGGGECPVLADPSKSKRSGCGARMGCHGCQAVRKDNSLTAMLDDPRNQFMQDLLRIRDYIAALQYHWGKRNWVSRQFADVDGIRYVKIQPDSFNDETLETLIRAYLTADRRERLRAERFDAALRAGRMPEDPYILLCQKQGRTPEESYLDRMRHVQFQVFDARKLVALDFYSAVLGKHSHQAFAVLEMAYQVGIQGIETDVPDLADAVPTNVPGRWFRLGPVDEIDITINEVRYSNAHFSRGLSHEIALMFADTDTYCSDDDQVHSVEGDTVFANESRAFDVDEESAVFVLDYIYPDDLRASYALNPDATCFDAVRTYLSLGTVSLSASGRRKLHHIVKQRDFLRTLGLYEMTPENLYNRAVELSGHRLEKDTQIDLFAA